jgi:polar amino acid transport system substrate-binding protein
MRRIARPLAALALTLGLATACTDAASDSPGASTKDDPSADVNADVNADAAALLPKDLESTGRIVFASDASYAPFEYFDTDNRTMIGLDVDLTDALAEVLGVEAKHVNAGFDTILPGLQSKKYDAAVSALGITDERREIVDFVPYLSMGSGLAVPSGNPDGLSLEDPTTLCGKTVSGLKGSIQTISILPELSTACDGADAKPIKIANFPTQNEANLALISGRADAIMADSMPLAYQGEQADGAFELAEGEDYDPVQIGVAVPNDSDLGPALAAAMQVLVDDGILADLLAKWGLLPDNIVRSTDLTR